MKSLVEFIAEQDLVNYRRLSNSVLIKGRWFGTDRGCVTGWPWSDDPAFQQFRFGNIRRDLDRTNRTLATDTFNNKSVLDKGFMANVLLHRLISRDEFSRQAGFFESFDKFLQIYATRRELNLPCRPASFISCSSDADFINAVKSAFEYTSKISNAIYNAPTLENAFKSIKTVPGLGKFTSWQCALDLIMLEVVKNTTNFVHIGPGAVQCLRNLISTSRTYVPFGVAALEYPKLVELVNNSLEGIGHLSLPYEAVEGALCEYTKYQRYQSKNYPGKYRYFSPSPEPLPYVPMDKIILEWGNERFKLFESGLSSCL